MSTNPQMNAQAVYKEHIAYGAEFPEWMQMANAAVNLWGKGQRTLQHAIALALQDAFARGAAGNPPKYTPPRDDSAAPTPTSSKTVLRRRTS